jgi:hypothetical protein
VDEHRLDGNAAAGVLGEIFAFEASIAKYGCARCGRSERLGGTMVYEVREMGTTVALPCVPA